MSRIVFFVVAVMFLAACQGGGSDNNPHSGDTGSLPTNHAPTAFIKAESDDLEFVFDASQSTDPEGDLVSYFWDFGDSTTDSGQRVIHRFVQAGSYTVTLTVTDEDGATDTEVLNITASSPPTNPPNQAPIANFTVSANGSNLGFNASESYDQDGRIVSYIWNFGDTSTAQGQQVSHQYTEGGDYTVTLTVTDDGGLSHTLAKSVTVTGRVNAAPQPRFSRNPSGGAAPLTVAFDASLSSDDGQIACSLQHPL